MVRGKVRKILDYKTHKSYVQYRRKKKLVKGTFARDRKELELILCEITKVIGDNMVKRDAGVLIKGLGYFFNWMMPYKKFPYKYMQGQDRSFYKNHHTEQRLYTLIFLPKEKSCFKDWSLDLQFSEKIKQGVKDRLLSGFRYKGYPYSLQNLM